MRFKKMIFLPVFILLSSCFFSQAQDQKINYRESDQDFANPERGFYIPLDAYAHKFIPLRMEEMLKNRTEMKTHGSATYGVLSTLLYRGYVLDTFVNKPLSEAFLNLLDQDFAMVRAAGVKMILRFAYTNKVHSGDCPDKEKICPPYGDAPETIMLAHIAQLKPLLQKNADVIAVLQEGFIGIWGENYYTDYFGDASGNGAGKILDSNWHDRNKLLKALLDALPANRMVQVRTPQIKQKFVYGPHAGTTVKALSDQEGYQNTDYSRIGFHNDCFLASIDDYGTFYDYGSSISPKTEANSQMRSYFEQDSRYGPVGGETCDDAFSPGNDCSPLGHAEEEMAAMHYSFLNTAYNNQVNNDWDSLGCVSSIKKRLGYRLVLTDATFPKKIGPARTITIRLNLINRGYASPYNPRDLVFILRHQQTGKVYSINSKADVRKWYSGAVHLTELIELPSSMPGGKYELLLNLPDPAPALSHRPEYSIRLANENIWEEKTGYHLMGVILKS